MPNRTFPIHPVWGGHQLAASLDLPEREPLAYALFAHCFTCGKGRAGGQNASRWRWRQKGIAVLRFDFTGPRPPARGDFANSTFSSKRRRSGAGRRPSARNPQEPGRF